MLTNIATKVHVKYLIIHFIWSLLFINIGIYFKCIELQLYHYRLTN